MKQNCSGKACHRREVMGKAVELKIERLKKESTPVRL